jgi:hypothetical protein
LSRGKAKKDKKYRDFRKKNEGAGANIAFSLSGVMGFATAVVGLPRALSTGRVKNLCSKRVRKKVVHLVCYANEYFLSHRARELGI